MNKKDEKMQENVKNKKDMKKKQFSFFDKRSTQYGSNMILMVIAVFGVLVLVNYIAGKELPRTDLTKDKQFTLSDQSKKIIADINEPIKVTAFFEASSPQKTIVEDLLTEYSAENENISVEYIDPDKSPAKVQLYGVVQYNTLVLEKGEKKEIVISSAESNITSAMLKLVRDERKKIYFTTGHGEKQINGTEQNTSYSLIRAELEKQIYDVEEISLLGGAGIPEDADVLVVAGPKNRVNDDEVGILRKYINERHGKILFLLDPLLDQGSELDAETGVGLTGLLNEYGIEYGDGLVVDRVGNYFNDASTLVVDKNKYARHQITQGLERVLFPVTSKVSQSEKLPENWTVTELMTSTIDSWLENNKTEITAAFSEEEDEKGPISIGAVAQEISPTDAKDSEDASSEEKARLVVIGDSDFPVDPFVNPSLGVYNADLFVNAINWLAAEEELISILPKNPTPSEITLTGTQSQIIFYITVIVMPLVVGVIGFVLIFKRKRKRK